MNRLVLSFSRVNNIKSALEFVISSHCSITYVREAIGLTGIVIVIGTVVFTRINDSGTSYVNAKFSISVTKDMYGPILEPLPDPLPEPPPEPPPEPLPDPSVITVTP